MTAEETACYESHLAGASAVLEYGVGGSTVLAARSVGPKSLYSVETDPSWLAKVREHPAVADMIARGRATLVHVNLGATGRWGKPRNKMRFPQWPAYAKRPWQDGFRPDLVLVDGRFRVSCIMQALRHGGSNIKIAVHDFWPRKHYHSVLRFASVVDETDSLVVLQRIADASRWRARAVMWRHLYDYR